VAGAEPRVETDAVA